MAANSPATLLSISWMEEEFPTKAELILNPLGEIYQSGGLMLFGIHSRSRTNCDQNQALIAKISFCFFSFEIFQNKSEGFLHQN